MNSTLVVALVALVPAGMLFFGSAVLFRRTRTAPCLVQFIGACGFIVVILAHLCEGLHLFPWMGWGQERSVGHYIDFTAALDGIILFPTGYLYHALRR